MRLVRRGLAGTVALTLALCAIAVSMGTAAAAAASAIAHPVGRNLAVNGTVFRIATEAGFKAGSVVRPAILTYEGTAYLPVRLLGDVLGVEIRWETTQVDISTGAPASTPNLVAGQFANSIPMTAPSVRLVLDGAVVAQAGATFHHGSNQVPLVLRRGGGTYLPLPWLTAEIGLKDSYDASTNTLVVESSQSSTPPPVGITLPSRNLMAGGNLVASVPPSADPVAWFLQSSSGEDYPIFDARTASIDVPLAQAIPQGTYTLDARDLTTGQSYTAAVQVVSTWSYSEVDPFQFANRYDVTPLYDSGYDGQGETIALFEESDVQPSDLASWDAAFGLPAPNISVIAPEGDPGIVTTNEGGSSPLDEATLDVEWVHALAPYARIVIYAYPMTAGPDELAQAATSAAQAGDAAYSISFTVGADGTVGQDQALQSAVESGLVVFAATGDHGTTSPPFQAWPSTNPYVVAVGGTEVSSSGSEAYWNQGYSQGVLWAGGYGTTDYPAPSWQEALTQQPGRQVPDVSLLATNALDYEQGSWYVLGGTSLASPSWAAIWTLVSQYYQTVMGTRLTIPAVEAIYGVAESSAPQVTANPGFLLQPMGSPATLYTEMGFGPPLAMNLARDVALLY